MRGDEDVALRREHQLEDRLGRLAPAAGSVVGRAAGGRAGEPPARQRDRDRAGVAERGRATRWTVCGHIERGPIRWAGVGAATEIGRDVRQRVGRRGRVGRVLRSDDVGTGVVATAAVVAANAGSAQPTVAARAVAGGATLAGLPAQRALTIVGGRVTGLGVGAPRAAAGAVAAIQARAVQHAAHASGHQQQQRGNRP